MRINRGTVVFCTVLLFIGLWMFLGPAYAAPGLPSAIVRLPENENAILVEKKSQTLFVYKQESDRIVEQFQASCSTGEVGGIKQKAGDKKTPEGVYFLKDEYEDRYLSPIYGHKAFPTDYPNLVDKRAGKNGSAIWIHGTNKKLIPMDSNGCVALENENIVKLSEYVTLDSTPVIMVESIEISPRKVIQEQENRISEMLNQWAQAAGSGSYHDYLSFYSSDYLPDISWWESWLALRKQAQENGNGLTLGRERTGIYRQDKMFVVLFDSYTASGKQQVFIGKRKLFIEFHGDAHKIVGDTFQQIPEQFLPGKNPLVAAGRSIVRPAVTETEVTELVQRWLEAWSAKDMGAYASFYAEEFYSDGMDKKRWVRRKRALAGKYEYIQVTGRDFQITKDRIKDGTKDRCEVVFFQEYESSRLTTQGTKRLKLVNKGGLWKIYQESWKEK